MTQNNLSYDLFMVDLLPPGFPGLKTTSTPSGAMDSDHATDTKKILQDWEPNTGDLMGKIWHGISIFYGVEQWVSSSSWGCPKMEGL